MEQSRLYFLSLVLLAFPALADQCQITSPLPLPISIAGCTYANPANTVTFPFGLSTTTETITGLTASQGVCTDSNNNLVSSGGACGAGGGGGGGSSLAVANDVVRSSPTSDIIFRGTQVNESISGSSVTLTLNSSSVTLQGNLNSISAIAMATGTIQTQLTSVAASTGTLASAVASSTASIQSQVTSIASATGTIQTQLTSVAAATGTIQSQVTLVASATGQIATDTGTLNGLIFSHIVSLSTGVTGTLPIANLTVGASTYIQNTSALQGGSTAYPDFLYVGSSATVAKEVLPNQKSNILQTDSTGLIFAGQISPSSGIANGIFPSGVILSNQVSLSTGIMGSLPIANLTANATNYIQNRSTLQSGATAYPDFLQVATSTTFTTGAMQINGISYTWPSSQSGTQVLQNNGSGNLSWATSSGGSGGSATIGIYNGTSGNTGAVISTPIAAGNFDNSNFRVSNQGGATFYVTLMGVSLSTDVVGSLPASSIAAGTLGTSVILGNLVSLSTGVYGTLPIANLTTNATTYIQNSAILQTGATAYPDFIYVGSSATVSKEVLPNQKSSTLQTDSTGLIYAGQVSLSTGVMSALSAANLSGTNLPGNSTSYIQNTSVLQSGATAYPDFLYIGSSATIVKEVKPNQKSSILQTDSTGLIFGGQVSPSTGIAAGVLASNIVLGNQVSLSTGVTGVFYSTMTYLFKCPALDSLETNFAVNTSTNTGTSNYLTCSFDNTTRQYRNGFFMVPSNVNPSGTITIRMAGRSSTAAASKNVGWILEHQPLSNAGDNNGNYLVSVSSGLAVSGTQGLADIDSWTMSVSSSTWSANQQVNFRFSRDTSAVVTNNLASPYYLNYFTLEIPVKTSPSQ